MTQIASFLFINMYMKINIYRLQCVCRLWWLLRPSRTVTISTLRARRGSRGPASWSPWTASPGWRAGELWLAESRTQYSPLIGWRQGQEGDLEQAQLLQLHGALQLLRRGPEPLQQDGPAAVRGTPAGVRCDWVKGQAQGPAWLLVMNAAPYWLTRPLGRHRCWAHPYTLIVMCTKAK